MTPAPVNLAAASERIPDLWSPRVVGRMNEVNVKVARVAGEFVWHDHPDTDELFLVLTGRLVIRLRDGDVTLHPGDIYTVPRGVEHCPVADEGTAIALLEPDGVVNTGSAGGALTAPVDRPLD